MGAASWAAERRNKRGDSIHWHRAVPGRGGKKWPMASAPAVASSMISALRNWTPEAAHAFLVGCQLLGRDGQSAICGGLNGADGDPGGPYACRPPEGAALIPTHSAACAIDSTPASQGSGRRAGVDGDRTWVRYARCRQQLVSA